MPSPASAPDVIVGAGHNGLVAACYLARAGRDVVVVEQLDRPGGGARTEEVIPGYRFDLHSVAHNIINMTDIPAELDLAGAGLVYQEMDPFSVAVRSDGRWVRFYRSLEATVASISEVDRAEAHAYQQFIVDAIPLVRTILPVIRGDRGIGKVPGQLRNLARVLRSHPLGTLGDVLGPYEKTLQRRLGSDLTRGPVAAFAAHGGVGPTALGGSLFVFWQAAYHLFGQWHPRGGSQALTDALVARLRSFGGEVRCSAPVEGIETLAGKVTGVRLAGGERVAARTVMTAIDPRVALLDLLEPPLAGPSGADVGAARSSNVVQAVVHVAADRLPPYGGARAGDWNGLQSFVDRVEDLSRAWVQAEAGRLAADPPLYAFTTSALDDSLAPPGRHTVYLACPAAPARVDGGWPALRERFVDDCLRIVEERAPGFVGGVVDARAWTPADMEEQGGWSGAHPMHLDLGLDQLGVLRPTRDLAGWRTPVHGLYITGAGTNPTGGIAGTPGRLAARALLADQRR